MLDVLLKRNLQHMYEDVTIENNHTQLQSSGFF